MAQRGVGSDSDKLNPTHVTSSRALHHFDQRTRSDLCGDDDDKLLDVVGPPQSPLLPMSKYFVFFLFKRESGRLSFEFEIRILLGRGKLEVFLIDKNRKKKKKL